MRLTIRRTIFAIGAALLVCGCCSTQPAEAGDVGHLRIVSYNVAKLNSENDQNANCVPGSWN